MAVKYVSMYRSREALNVKTGETGTIVTSSKGDNGSHKEVRVNLRCKDGTRVKTSDITYEEFNDSWKVLPYGMNKWGEHIEVGSIWFMKNDFFGRDESWLAMVIDVGQFGITLEYVNWKRKGNGRTYSFRLDDMSLTTGQGAFKVATEEQEAYFHKRTKNKYKNKKEEELLELEASLEESC